MCLNVCGCSFFFLLYLEGKKSKKKDGPGKAKVKKSSSLIKRFKLRTRSASASVQEAEKVEEPSSSVENTVERQTPEGDDSLPIEKAASDTNLTENSWKSAETLTREDIPKSTSVINIQSYQYQVTISEDALPQRTKSLEDIKGMPAFGDLILDPNAMVNNHAKLHVKATRFKR